MSYINLELMNQYLETTRDKVLPNCPCRTDPNLCIHIRKQIQKIKEMDKRIQAHEIKKRNDKVRIRRKRRNAKIQN